MTVEPDDTQDDVLSGLASLRTYDVSVRRSRSLRRRCHALLQPEPPPKSSVWLFDGTLLQRVIVPALGGAWCLGYLVEILRRAAAIYDPTR